MRVGFFTFLYLCLFTLWAGAQTDNKSIFTIKGQVVDSLSNESVPYATLRITAVQTPDKVIKLLACDTDGKFETTLSNAGNYILSMQSIGKAPAEKRFQLPAGKSQLDLGQLYMHDDNQQLKEVTVTAQKPLVKVEIDKLTYNLEDDPEAQTNNTLDMLRKVPMVTVDGNDEIQLKGSTNFKIYMNGKPSNLLSNNPADVLKSMPASSIKNIEVITDPGAKYDAEGVGGIINIITTKNALQGYTGTLRASASTLKRFGGGAYVSAKAGSFGITANYNYNHDNSPWNESSSIRENFATENREASTLNQTGRSKRKGPFQFGYLEASYEIDSLNLISVGANLFRGKSTNLIEYQVEQLTSKGATDYRYNRNSRSTETFGSTDINVDYQHSTQKKDELLTFSYRFSNSPNDNDNYTDLFNESNYPLANLYPQKNINNASTKEHTGQIDYTTPTLKDQTFEIGAKYIFRESRSNTLQQIYNDSIRGWEELLDANSDFRHKQHVYSGYLGYVIKLDKFGFKTGVRAEGTSLNVHYAYAPEMNFSTNYFDVVPNGTISYQINMAQQIRIGYNMRIQRPGIWFLNPYVDDTDPQNILYGNPNLNSEKSNNFNLNYSLFNQKFNVNASLSYSYINNSIERYTFVNNQGISETTYGNIGKKQSAGAFLYASWTPVPLLRIFMNGGMDYIDLKSPSQNMENNGFSGRIFAGTQFTFPMDFRLDLHGGYFSPRIQLQSKNSAMYFTGISLNKSFLKKKLTLSLSFQNPFWKTIKMESTTTDPTFHMVSKNYINSRDFRFSISYRFGTLKESIKKVRRGISNDDMKSGENNGGGTTEM